MEFDNWATALKWAARNGKPFYTVRMDYNKILVIER
ncbi:hypothetical protein PONTUS_202 [Vibrio phage Pontus]|uniref:Uncharacterized protein n=1 Tax=Vibrio phage Pontus TaxID=2590874 RepID=A0A4Y6EI69_9CAUD|nr:hypothetical protein KNU59_gp004 [Vibrio phage Pontus]YP_010102799.1 hypothetical protein KNU59_gp101 [Vibrio phage Pontus]QDF14653.1 hypothetical protein PONTUS_4 [Vibrio phage Pontus]QDF14827.1 hypothetical protein PONTUS_202 [Vibrio phage Pontus]